MAVWLLDNADSDQRPNTTGLSEDDINSTGKDDSASNPT